MTKENKKVSQVILYPTRKFLWNFLFNKKQTSLFLSYACGKNRKAFSAGISACIMLMLES